MSGEFANQMLSFPTLNVDRVGQFSVHGQVSTRDETVRRVPVDNWLEEAGARSGILLFQFQPQVSVQSLEFKQASIYEFSLHDSAARLRFDSGRLQLATSDGRDLPASTRSLEVLSVLLKDPRKVISQEDILGRINEQRVEQQRTRLSAGNSIRQAIGELREALSEVFDDEEDPIEVRRGAGYLLPATNIGFLTPAAKKETPLPLVGTKLSSSLGLLGVYGVGIAETADLVSRFPGSQILFSRFAEQLATESFNLQTFDGRLKMSAERREVTVDGKIIDGLTKQEFDLLQFFMRNPNNVHTRLTILQNAWTQGYYSDEYTGDRTVDVHVRRLRGKIGDNAAKIVTVRGHGYKFENKKEERSTATVEYEGGWLQDALDSVAE